MDTENFILLKEYESYDLELKQIEIDFIRNLKNNPLELETLSPQKQRLGATKYVGQVVIQPTGRIIKIEPKIGNVKFFDLLMYSEGLPQSIFEEIATVKGGESLIDLLAMFFIRLINEIIEVGLYRKYYRVSEQTNTIRGRLLLAQTIRSPDNLSGKVWCEYDKIGFDILENQTILYCTRSLLFSVKRPEIKDDLLLIRKNLMSQGVSEVFVQSYQLDTLSFHRLNEHYEKGLMFCKHILDGIWYQEFLEHEELASFTWLHDMNDLFEKFVTRVLAEELKPDNFDIIPQKHFGNILEKVEGNDPPDIKPDILIKKNRDYRLIVDTKYKKKGPSSGDYYQATSYSLKLNCDCVLICPKVKDDINNKFKIQGEDLYVYSKSIDLPEDEDVKIIEYLKKQILDIVKPLLT